MIKATAKTLAKGLLDLGSRLNCKWEYERQTFSRFNERPVEYGFVFRMLARVYPKTVLDVGTGTTALPHLMRNCGCLVTATDNVRDYWPAGMVNRHYHVVDDDITHTRLQGQFDLITCVSVLEHIEDSAAAVRNMFGLLKTNGRLILTFPYTEHSYIRNVYELPDSRYGRDAAFICQSYSRQQLDRWLRDNAGVIQAQEYWQFWDGPYWTVGDQVIPPREVTAGEQHQISCVLVQKQA